MHTKDMLAQALRDVGLDGMAELAANGYYHDFLSPLDLPEMALVTALGVEATAANKDPDKARAIEILRSRVIAGEFDASRKESDEWAASPEGQDAFRRLTSKKGK